MKKKSRPPQGISHTFAPGQGVYHGPEMVMLPKELHDALLSAVERVLASSTTGLNNDAIVALYEAVKPFRTMVGRFT